MFNFGPGLFIQGQLQNLLNNQQQMQLQSLPVFFPQQSQSQAQGQGQSQSQGQTFPVPTSGSIPVVITPGGGNAPQPPARVDSFIFQQPTPAASWLIAHNLGSVPIVGLYQNDGSQTFADVRALNPNQVLVQFSQPVAGFAVLDI